MCVVVGEGVDMFMKFIHSYLFRNEYFAHKSVLGILTWIPFQGRFFSYFAILLSCRMYKGTIFLQFIKVLVSIGKDWQLNAQGLDRVRPLGVLPLEEKKLTPRLSHLKHLYQGSPLTFPPGSDVIEYLMVCVLHTRRA